jgi:GMP synthase PP-ATPase subunit
MNLSKIFVVVSAVVMLSACVAQWQNVSSANQTVQQSGMSIDLPVGWVSIAVNKQLQIASKDGPGLNTLALETVEFKDMEKSLKVNIDKNMDMLEASKKYIAYWSNANQIPDFDIIKEDFVEVQGIGHFYVEWKIKDKQGSTIRYLAQGTIKNDSIVAVLYAAPNIYYYDKNLPIVKSVFSSIRHA